MAERGYRDSSRYPDLNWHFRILLADLRVKQGKPSNALELLSVSPEPGLSGIRFKRSLSRANAFCNSHSYEQAEQDFTVAEALASNATAATELLLLRARCNQVRGKLEESSAQFAKVHDSGNASEFANLYALLGLGFVALKRYQYEEAAHWYVLAQEPEARLKAIPYEEITRGNLGFLYFELGDFQRALENSKAAVELAERLNSTSHLDNWMLDLGRAYQASARSGLAQENYVKALKIARTKGDDFIAARCLHNLAQMELRRGNVTAADDYHQQAQKLRLQEEGDLRDLRIDAAFISAAKRNWTSAEQDFLQLISEVHDTPRLKWGLEAGLARLYADEEKPQLADEWFRKSISTMESAAAHMKRIEFKIAMLDNWPIFDDYIAFLYARKERERALQVAQLARARNLAEELGFKPGNEDARVWVRRIQAMLRARHSVMLAYYEAEHETYAWVLTGTTLEMKTLGAGQNEMETLADAYRTEIDQHSSIDASPAQQKLYEIVIKPISKFIPHGAHVILVADSALYRINFETLICDDSPLHYWIDDAEIENASSIDLLLADSTISRRGRGILIIGSPSQVSPQYPLLPHAHEEVESVKAKFAPSDVKSFEGRAATPDVYQSSGPSRFKYIEFASHSTASSSDPMTSAIVLSNGSRGFQLYARDIVQTKPRLNAELVSISGCFSSGKLNTSAEGLLGLQWAFMRAGAHQVVAGLWDVDDKTSPELMGALYAGIVHGESPARALRAAKLKLIHSAKFPPAPYYWASLQLYTGS